MQGYQSFTDLDLNDIPPERRYYVRQAPIGSVTALGLSSGEWIVLLVSRRTVTRPTFEEMRSDLESRVGPYVAEYRLIRDLRASEEIRVDSVVFESMVDFD